MRKAIAIFLILALLAGMMGCAAAYDGEIVFQEIPWGTDREEALSLLLGKGYIPDEYMEMIGADELAAYFVYEQGGSYLGKNRSGISLHSENDVQRVLYTLLFRNPFDNVLVKKIAGYSVDEINLCFADNRTESALIAVYLQIQSMENYEVFFDDLKEKLVKVYGKAETGKATGVTGKNITFCAWEGDQDTCVWLFADMGVVQLVYGTLNARNILKEYLTAKPAAVTPNPDDTDGL